jgi:hypothetical protein
LNGYVPYDVTIAFGSVNPAITNNASISSGPDRDNRGDDDDDDVVVVPVVGYHLDNLTWV